MRVLPFLKDSGARTEKYIVNFRGINYGEGYAEGEFSQCENLSSEKYPCITPRRERVKVGQYAAPTALHTKDGMVVIDGTQVLWNGVKVGDVTEGRKQIAAVGNYVCIFPDKWYLNVADGIPEGERFQNMEAEHTSSGLVFTDSTITTTGADWPFRVGDAVEITGCTIKDENGKTNNKTPIIRGVEGKVLTFYENTLVPGTEAGSVTIARRVPDLDFICESNYRLWGVKGNTIYGSRYSDPLNFSHYDGLAGDSYAIDVGTEGDFTACVPYASHICFFKENTLHKLYGTKPSNFQIVTSSCYGVQAGSERSVAIVNEQLIYKGVHGVYAYSGGIPDLISECFGVERFWDASAACDGERYYISMRGRDGWHLYVYDVIRGVWLREDATEALDMTSDGGCVYYAGADGGIYRIDRESGRNVPWSFELCPFNEVMDERKGYSRFNMRVEMAAGSWLSVDVMTEHDRKWREVYTTHNERARIHSVPIIPTRCDQVRVRVRGEGDCIVRAFVREFTVETDV